MTSLSLVADRVRFTGKSFHEQLVTALVLKGAALGVLFSSSSPAAVRWLLPGLLALSTLTLGQLLWGKERVSAQSARLVLAGLPFVLGIAGVPWWQLAVISGALLGAGVLENGAGWLRRGLGAAAGVAGIAWSAYVIEGLQRLLGSHPLVTAVLSGAAAGLLLGLTQALPWFRIDADAEAGTLAKLYTPTSERARAAWARIAAGLKRAPRGVQPGLRASVKRQVREYAKKAEQLEGSALRLLGLEDQAQREELAKLKEQIATTDDGPSRERLQAAAAAISDTLETVSTLRRQHERLEADVVGLTAQLERAAFAIGATGTGDAEWAQTASRLA